MEFSHALFVCVSPDVKQIWYIDKVLCVLFSVDILCVELGSEPMSDLLQHILRPYVIAWVLYYKILADLCSPEPTL